MTRSSPSAARTAPSGRLAELAALGPYFAVEVYPPGAPLSPPWQPLDALTGTQAPPGIQAPSGTLDPFETLTSSGTLTALALPAPLVARIRDVRERLAAAAGRPADGVEFRVAASVAQLGLCSRLLSPVLGAAAAGWALPVDIARARWIPALGGPFPLSLPEPSRPERPQPKPSRPERPQPKPSRPEPHRPSPGDGAPSAGVAACLALLAGPVALITRSVAAMAVSPRVLWGNVASAVSGAATMIAKARPDLAAPAAAAATAMLGYPALAGTYTGSPGAAFRRRNCCLIYRLSPPGAASYCGDCVLGPV